MIRSFTGTAFAIAMVLIVATKHAALGFCLCNGEFVLERNCCDLPAAAEAAEAEPCGCCFEGGHAEPSPPCDDCVVEFDLDPGHYLWSAGNFPDPEESAVDLPLPRLLSDDGPLESNSSSLAGSIRGSPPRALPIYLCTRSLRL